MQHSPTNRTLDVIVDAAHLIRHARSGSLVWLLETNLGVFVTAPGAPLGHTDAWTRLRTLTLDLDDGGRVISAIPAARMFIARPDGCTVEAAIAVTGSTPTTCGEAR